MKTRRYRYADPTGGGDDVIVEVPEWVSQPDEIMFRDNDGTAHYFVFDSEEDED